MLYMRPEVDTMSALHTFERRSEADSGLMLFVAGVNCVSDQWREAA